MAEPTETAPAAAPADGVSEVAAAIPPVATARGFRFLGKDKSVHTALGGGKSFAGGMDKRDSIVGANTPISQRRKGAIEVAANEATLSPQQERFMRRQRAIESAETELSPPKSHHITMTSLVEPGTTKIATMPKAILLPASSVAGQTTKALQLEEVAISGSEMLDKQLNSGGDVDMQLQHLDDIDKQRLRWEALDEEEQVWDAIDEQHKSRNKEDKRQKQEDRKQKKENNKKRKLEVEAKKKELEERRNKSAKIRESKMIREQAKGSPLARLPLASSPGVHMLLSRVGSKRGRSSSVRTGNSPSEKRAKSRSPSMSSSPSPTTSKTVRSRGRKIRRLTSAVWRDFIPRYDGGKLIEA